MDELKVEDFPIEATEKVKLSFERNRKMERVAQIMIAAIYDQLANMKDIEPWRVVAKEMPEIYKYARETKVSYDNVSGSFNTAAE